MKLASSRSAESMSQPQFRSVQEWDDTFLTLFPHRYDYLWADYPNPGERPEWKTESRYPLSDRLIRQNACLYGVRFGPTTHYCMLDIDRKSAYHPVQDHLAWRRIKEALEPLGLVELVLCTSSSSKGLHLYFPFQDAQPTWMVALAVSTLLENAGFKLAPGQLEVFPNCKPYSPSGDFSLYQGHRLPMQIGSYLLNTELQPVWGSQSAFVGYWQFAQSRNVIHAPLLERTIKAARRRQYRITNKAVKFLNDLNAEIELGWAGEGQTNRLLGRITLRSYIFAHVLYADAPLEGAALVRDIVAVAQSLPGYAEYCGHQHELEQRAREWAQAVEGSHYFHYGKRKLIAEVISSPAQGDEPGWNHHQQEQARERIRQAVADLLERESLPAGITERFDALVGYSISGATLYKYRDLWHPRHLQIPESGDHHEVFGQDCTLQASWPESLPNLLGERGCNHPSGGSFSLPGEGDEALTGCNSLPGAAAGGVPPRSMTQAEGIAYIQSVINQIKARRAGEKHQRRQRDVGASQLTLPLPGTPEHET